jgi:hypothetical protein
LSEGSSDCLILFAKPPIPGRVKTRLIPAIGAEAATRLYRQLLEHALSAASSLSAVRKELWWDGPEEQECRAYAERFGMTLFRQRGADLGERMHHALESALQTAERTVLIGSDSLDYSAAYLNMAFEVLSRNDAVLGPAMDGGYLLIGMRQPQAHLFHDVPWSTGRVVEVTRQRLREQGLSWQELPTMRDIDDISDLQASSLGNVRYPAADSNN